MAQKIYMNYKQAMNSNDFNRWKLGILEPGRYRGFDTITNSGLNFTILHTTTGIAITEEDLSVSNKTGIALTKQGFVIQESASITGLSCGTNAANLSIRIDWVICTHEDVNTIGGQAATYSVLQGGPSSAEPTLSNPEKQILIGKISIPGSASTLNSATYTPAQVPLLGGQNIFTNFPELDAKYGKLDVVSAYTAQQQWGLDTTNITVTSNKWTPATGEGNSYTGGPSGALVINEIASTSPGLIVVLKARVNTITLNLNGTPAAGGLTIRCTGLEAFGLTTLVMQPGDIVVLENYNFSEWKVISAIDRIGRELLTLDTALDAVIAAEAADAAAITILQNDVTELQAAHVSSLTQNATQSFNNGVSRADITGLTFTTPNDGITRKYLINFKGTFYVASTNVAGGRVHLMVDGSDVDLSEFYQDQSGSDTEETRASLSCSWIGTVGPNKIIKVQGVSSISNIDITDSKLVITQQR